MSTSIFDATLAVQKFKESPGQVFSSGEYLCELDSADQQSYFTIPPASPSNTRQDVIRGAKQIQRQRFYLFNGQPFWPQLQEFYNLEITKSKLNANGRTLDEFSNTGHRYTVNNVSKSTKPEELIDLMWLFFGSKGLDAKLINFIIGGLSQEGFLDRLPLSLKPSLAPLGLDIHNLSVENRVHLFSSADGESVRVLQYLDFPLFINYSDPETPSPADLKTLAEINAHLDVTGELRVFAQYHAGSTSSRDSAIAEAAIHSVVPTKKLVKRLCSEPSSQSIDCKTLFEENGRQDIYSIATVFVSKRNEDAGGKRNDADAAFNGQLPIGTPGYETIRVAGKPLAAEGDSAVQNFRDAFGVSDILAVEDVSPVQQVLDVQEAPVQKVPAIQAGLVDFLVEAVRPGTSLHGPVSKVVVQAFNGSYIPLGSPFVRVEFEAQEDGSVSIINRYSHSYMAKDEAFKEDPEVSQVSVCMVHNVKIENGEPVISIIEREFDVAGENEQDLNTMGVLLAPKLKLEFKADPSKINSKTLLDAAKYGNIEAVKALLAAGVQKTVTDQDGETALHYAAREGHKEVVTRLLSQGLDVAARDTDGKTPLHYAATAYGKAVKGARKEITRRQALQKEAKPRSAAKKNTRRRALPEEAKLRRVPAVANAEAIVLTLVDAGADVTVKDKNQKEAWQCVPRGDLQTYLYVLTLVEGYCHHLEQSGASQRQRLETVQKLKKALLVQDEQRTATLAERVSKFKEEYKPELIAMEKPGLASLLSSRFKRVFNNNQDVINPQNNETYAQAFTRYIQKALSEMDEIIIIQDAKPMPKAEAKTWCLNKAAFFYKADHAAQLQPQAASSTSDKQASALSRGRGLRHRL